MSDPKYVQLKHYQGPTRDEKGFYFLHAVSEPFVKVGDVILHGASFEVTGVSRSGEREFRYDTKVILG